VIERLLETWLNKANERSFQIPFCHALAYDGYTVVHLTRHCAMEVGKDILAVAPDGVPCAYQLKGVDGGKLTLSAWRDDLSKQIHPLVHRKIVHPSIPPHAHHRSYIVINGDFDEEVLRDIDDFNRASVDAGHPERKVETIVKGQLFQMFKGLQSDFWATNLNDLKTYLELLTEDGQGQLPKEKLATLFESALPFQSEGKKPPSIDQCARSITGCAIICSSAISAFTNAKNHLAEFEAWVLFWAYSLALAEKWGLPLSKLGFAISLAQEAIYSSLGRLCDELMSREHFVQGDALSDWPLYRVRMTHLLGLMGIYGLWRAQRVKDNREEPDEDREKFLRSFCKEHGQKGWLWGEYAVPQILAYFFYLRTIDATPRPDFLIHTLIRGIVRNNRPGSGDALASPYYDAESILPHVLGLEPKPLRDSFAGSSYMLEGLMHLFVRANFKQQMRLTFPEITRVGFRSFATEEPWQFYLWRNRGIGTNHHRFLKPPHKWCELTALAAECEGKDLPNLIKQFPIQYLCFQCVYPHRTTACGVRWISTQLEQM
jgi:hypothetical protein